MFLMLSEGCQVVGILKKDCIAVTHLGVCIECRTVSKGREVSTTARHSS